jgi:hypothetical protein
MKNIIIIIFAGWVLVSCDVPYALDVNQAEPTVTIEGLVTDVANTQFVKITRSNGFYGGGKSPAITNATVTVSDDIGNEYLFINNPNGHPDSSAFYLPQTPFAGQTGHTYKLNVVADGKQFQATDVLTKILPIDSITYEVDPNRVKQRDNKGKIYSVKLYAHEDPSTKDYYLFKFYRNDTLAYTNETDIYYTDDTFLSDHIEGIPAPVYFKQGEKVRVESYSISRDGYVFYNDLSTLLNNDSGMFSPIPSSPRTNLNNGALGFFQASQLNVRQVEIK